MKQRKQPPFFTPWRWQHPYMLTHTKSSFQTKDIRHPRCRY